MRQQMCSCRLRRCASPSTVGVAAPGPFPVVVVVRGSTRAAWRIVGLALFRPQLPLVSRVLGLAAAKHRTASLSCSAFCDGADGALYRHARPKPAHEPRAPPFTRGQGQPAAPKKQAEALQAALFRLHAPDAPQHSQSASPIS